MVAMRYGYKETWIWIQGYKDTRIQEYNDTRIQGYNDTRIQGYKDTSVQGYKVQGYKDKTIYNNGDTLYIIMLTLIEIIWIMIMGKVWSV